MADLRTLLAAALGIGLGVLFVVYPQAVIRVQTVGRLPHDRGGEYGEDAASTDRWQWVVRLLGVGVLAAGVYFGATALLGV